MTFPKKAFWFGVAFRILWNQKCSYFEPYHLYNTSINQKKIFEDHSHEKNAFSQILALYIAYMCDGISNI